MKAKVLLSVLLAFLFGSQLINPQSKTGNLPVIDLSKTYPQKVKNLQDIADIEYIALETTDAVLLSDKAVLSCVSDNYILVYEPLRGDIFVFNRTGKTVSHFNHKGQGPGEYPMISQVIGSIGIFLDNKSEEIFVCSQSIFVYTLKGEYKRTIPVNTLQNDLKVFNFDDESLLVYNDFVMDIDKQNNPNTKPYSLISKKDGSLISILDIHLPNRNSTQTRQKVGPGQTKGTAIYFPSSNIYYGQDFVIADISSDTLYILSRDRKLTPLLTRRPSTQASDPKIIWMNLLTTDKFILIGKFALDLSGKGGGGKIPIIMYEFATGEINETTFLDLDVEIRHRRWGPGKVPAIAKNMTAELIWPSSIINAYKAKQLKGNIAKFAKNLDEDDNPVVRIVKFR